MWVISSWRIRRTTQICLSLVAVLVGLGLAFHEVKFDSIWCMLVLVLLVLFWKIQVARVVFLVILMGMFGLIRGNATHKSLQSYTGMYGEEGIFTGRINDDPSFDPARQQTTFTITNIRTSGKSLIGLVQVFTPEKSEMISRGDEVSVGGTLRPSKGTTKQGTVSFAQVAVLSENRSILESLRRRFFDSVRHALPDPHSSLGLGYLVGAKADIPKELSEQLATTGLTHIVAVSGYNLTIIVQLVRRLFGKKSAYQSVLFSGLLLVGFLFVSGFSASIVRAAVVCSFSLAAWYYGRIFNPLLLLLLSGVITAFVNPLYIWGDPGWYLSFLAFAGVLILAPLVIARIYKRHTPNSLVHTFIETLCAQLATIPYTLYLFGGVSLIAPISNVVILPLIPFIMLATFITGVTGMVIPNVASYLGIIPTALIGLQMSLVKMFSNISWAHVTITIPVELMVALFVMLTLLAATLAHSVRAQRVSKSDIITVVNL